MFASAAGAAVPLMLAGKALNAITTIAAEGKAGNFTDAMEKTARGAAPDAGGPVTSASGAGPSVQGRAGTAELQPLNGAPLPPPPAVSQQPIPPTVDGIHQLYATMRDLR